MYNIVRKNTLGCHASEGWHPGIKKLDASLRWHDNEERYGY